MRSSIFKEQAGDTGSAGAAHLIGVQLTSEVLETLGLSLACVSLVESICLGSVLRMMRTHAEGLEFGCKYGGEIRCYLFNCGCSWSAV